MYYNPILEGVFQISQRNYFKLQRLKFWQGYAELMGYKQIHRDWFKMDSYTYPYMEDLDIETGERKVVPVEASLHAQIVNDIKSRFKRSYSLYEKHLIEFDKEYQKENFRITIGDSLEMIKKRLTFIDAEIPYLTTIEKTFVQEWKTAFPQTKSNIDNSNRRNSSFKLKYKRIKTDKGKTLFKMFFDDLKQHKLVAPNTAYFSFKKLFQGETPTEKIKWIGSKAQLVSFIKTLVSKKDVIESYNHWLAVEESFEIQKNGFKKYKLEKLHTATELTDLKKLEEIKTIIEKLDI